MSFSLKSFFADRFKSYMKKVDFVKLLERLSKEEPGKSYLEERSKPGPAFPDQESIASLAVSLSERSFQAKNDHINRRELQSHADLISCAYDWELHRTSKAAFFNLITHLFVSRDLENLYVSKDNRELAHLPKLREAREANRGVIFLINHTSHFDEFIFDVFLDNLNLQLPLFAAGQNMMATPSLTRLFMLGSYVIVRKGASRSYLSVLFHYCQALGELGKPQGIFLEAWSGGARTRDGSLRYPRRLVTLQGALAAREDVLIQPVVLSYSRVPEDLDLSEGKSILTWANGSHMLRGALRRPAAPVRGLVSGLKGLFGRTYVGFGEGKFLSELKEEYASASQGRELDEFAALYAIKEIARDKKIMASQLAALGLGLASKRNSLDIAGAAEESLSIIRDYHQRVFESEPDLEDFVLENPMQKVVEDGLQSLKLRKIIKGNIVGLKRLPKILSPHGLSYYATHSDRRLYSPAAKENMVVCGGNPWGFALVVFLGRRTLNDRKFHNSSLSLYDSSEELISELADLRERPEFEGTRLPKNVFPTSDDVEAFRKANDVVVATAPDKAAALLKIIFSIAGDLRSVILASRGFDPLSHRLTVQIAWEAAASAGKPDVDILALTGPFLPEDLVGDKGGLFILAGPRKGEKLREAPLFKFGNFKVYESHDPLGAQVAASLSDAYSLYGAYLEEHRELKDPEQITKFIQDVSREAKILAVAMGASPSTFDSDNPAWLSEFIYNALTSNRSSSVRLAVQKGPEALRAYVQNQDDENLDFTDKGVSGYFSIKSAHLLAKHLGLKLPHMERAHKIFWGT